MSEPSAEAIEFVARWACHFCSEIIWKDGDIPECEDCDAYRKWHAKQLDAFSSMAVERVARLKADIAERDAKIEELENSLGDCLEYNS